MNPLYYIISGLLILLILVFSFYIKQKRKIKNINDNLDKEYNIKKEQQEENLRKEYDNLNQELNTTFQNKIQQLNNSYAKKLEEINNTLLQKNKELNQFKEEQINNIKKDIEQKREQEESILTKEIQLKRKNAEDKLQDELTTAREWFNNEIEKLRLSKENYENNFNEAAQEYVKILDLLEDFRARRDVVNSQILREKELQDNTDFYRICLTDEEIEDLKLIKEIEYKFNNKEVLHRAAFDCYIKRPLQEMEKRVLNGKKPSGIYIITYIPTGEIYIGRSTDINNRWQEHCKSAYGIGTIAHSSLHTKMARDGLWNFTFQILEEVSKDKLNEREKYWIDLYGAQSLSNQKAGG